MLEEVKRGLLCSFHGKFWALYMSHVTIHAEVGRVLGGGSQSGVEGGGSRKWLEGYTNIAHIDQFWTNFLGRGVVKMGLGLYNSSPTLLRTGLF